MKLRALLFFLLILFSATTVSAQTVAINEVAEFNFERGLEAYQARDFNTAYQRFVRVVNDFPLHRKTTAAMLMAGKALFSQDMNRESVDLFDRLIARFPDSRYVTEAQALRQRAATGQGGGVISEVFDLGITLPLESDFFTRALFNGVRIAVDEHNAANPRQPVRMVFRDSGADANASVSAVTDMIRVGQAEAIIGPLFSQVARAAGEVAERSRIVMIPPMATDGTVSEGRQYVFQASATYKMRGKLMARYAVRTLGLRRLGVVFESDSPNAESAAAFKAEVVALGAEISFEKPLSRSTDWSRLSRVVGTSTMNSADAVYMPVSGRDALDSIRDALNELDAMRATVLVLGNPDWHNIEQTTQASRYRTAYTSDFWAELNDPAVRAFGTRFQQISGEQPDQLGLAYAGYDLAKYLISMHMAAGPNQSLAQVMKTAPRYEGLGRRFDFTGGNVNQGTYILRYRDGQIVLGE